jgi:hypothetical protein
VVALTQAATEDQNAFRSKVRSALELLLRKVGFEALEPLVPRSHTKQLEHLRKMRARNEKQKADKAKQWQQQHSAAALLAKERKAALGLDQVFSSLPSDSAGLPLHSTWRLVMYVDIPEQAGEGDIARKPEPSYEDLVYGDDNEEDEKARADSDKAKAQRPGRRRTEPEAKAWIRDADVDFLDAASAVRAVVAQQPQPQGESAAEKARRIAMETRDGFRVDEKGRLVVPDAHELEAMRAQQQEMEDIKGGSSDSEGEETADRSRLQWKKAAMAGQKRGRDPVDKGATPENANKEADPNSGAWQRNKKQKAASTKRTGDITGAVRQMVFVNMHFCLLRGPISL